MVGHGGSSAGSYLADPTSPIPSHCASIVATSTLRVNFYLNSILLDLPKTCIVSVHLSIAYSRHFMHHHIEKLKGDKTEYGIN